MRARSRKLLVASVGVASVTYAAVGASVTGCGSSPAGGLGDAGVSDAPGAGEVDAGCVVGNAASPCFPDDTVSAACAPPGEYGYVCYPACNPVDYDPESRVRRAYPRPAEPLPGLLLRRCPGRRHARRSLNAPA